MKKLIAAVALFGSVCAFGAIDDTTVIVGSKGPDKYADGTQALVGECYALVWSQNEFGGFNADGSLVNPEDVVFVILPRADENGACKTFGYDVPRSIVEKGGRISLWLLDTRIYGQDGTAKPCEVKGWDTKSVPVVASAAKVQAEIQVSAPGAKSISGAAAGEAVATAVPADVPQPKITSFKIEDGYAIIEVANTVPFISYDLASGDKPGALEKGKAVHPVSGAATAGDTITLIKPVKEGGELISVNRK